MPKAANLQVPGREIKDGDATSFQRQRVTNQALDETYFKVALAAGLQPYEGVVTEPKNGDAIVMRFPAAAAGTNAHAQRTVESRALWPKTRPRVSVWYTSATGSTNTFNLRFVLRVFGNGSTMTNSVFVTDFSPAGPAVAGDVKFISCVGGGVFPTSPFGVAQFRLGRLGGDANANGLDILLAVVTLEEVA